MALHRMDHVGVVVEDLDAAIAFFTALGMEVLGRHSVGGDLVARIIAVDEADSNIAMLKTPGDRGRLELIEYVKPGPADDHPTPPLANVPGLRHLCFAVDDLQATLNRLRPHGAELVGDVVDYEGSYLLCYLRGPNGIIIELAEKLG